MLNLCHYDQKPEKKTKKQNSIWNYPRKISRNSNSQKLFKKIPAEFRKELLKLERIELESELMNLAVLVLRDPKSLEELPIASTEDNWKNYWCDWSINKQNWNNSFAKIKTSKS